MKNQATTEAERGILAVGALYALAAGLQGCGGESTVAGSSSAQQQQVLRGRYLVTAAGDCAGCHSPNDPMWLAGYTPGTPGQPFIIGTFKTYPANLTPDPDTGLGKWSAQELFNALRTGKDDEGH